VKGSRLQTPSSELQIAQILAILHKWGIHTLGQLAALNKKELRDRLGNDAVRLWERPNGTATACSNSFSRRKFFQESFEFDHEIEAVKGRCFSSTFFSPNWRSPFRVVQRSW